MKVGIDLIGGFVFFDIIWFIVNAIEVYRKYDGLWEEEDDLGMLSWENVRII